MSAGGPKGIYPTLAQRVGNHINIYVRTYVDETKQCAHPTTSSSTTATAEKIINFVFHSHKVEGTVNRGWFRLWANSPSLL